MPSLVELAEIARAAYADAGDVRVDLNSGKTAVWSRRAPVKSFCFYAASFASPGGDEVLAFRGTDGFGDGVIDDLEIALGTVPIQLLQALSATSSIGTGAKILTGHSLGGALAALVAARRNRGAVTFNAPGVFAECRSTFPIWQVRERASCANARVMNIRIAGDPVSSWWTTGRQVGARPKTLPAPNGVGRLELIDRHAIDTVVSAVRADPKNFENLSF